MLCRGRLQLPAPRHGRHRWAVSSGDGSGVAPSGSVPGDGCSGPDLVWRAHAVASANVRKALKPGTAEHTLALRAATWRCLRDSSASGCPALSPGVHETHDVFFAVRDQLPIAAYREKYMLRRNGYSYYVPNPGTFNAEALIAEGHVVIERSSVILDADSLDIVAVLTLGENARAVVAAADKFPTAVSSRYSGTLARGVIGMHGIRRNRYAKGGPQIGRYSATEELSPERRRLLGGIAMELTALERALSPALAEAKFRQVRTVTPGIFPGVSAKQCSAYAMGLSKGIATALHTDDSAVENICWNVRGACTGDYCFSVFGYGVMFLLEADAAAASVLVCADVLHGTVCTSQKHSSIGVVLTQKGELNSNESKARLQAMRSVERKGGVASTLPQ